MDKNDTVSEFLDHCSEVVAAPCGKCVTRAMKRPNFATRHVNFLANLAKEQDVADLLVDREPRFVLESLGEFSQLEKRLKQEGVKISGFASGMMKKWQFTEALDLPPFPCELVEVSEAELRSLGIGATDHLVPCKLAELKLETCYGLHGPILRSQLHRSETEGETIYVSTPVSDSLITRNPGYWELGRSGKRPYLGYAEPGRSGKWLPPKILLRRT